MAPSPRPLTCRLRRYHIDRFIAGFRDEFRRYHRAADASLSRLDDEAFFGDPGADSNSAGILVKHLAGNLRSRWTDFLTTDGEKADRDRDSEFELTIQDTRTALMENWSSGWRLLYDTLNHLSDGDLGRVIRLRGQPVSVSTAIAMQLAHAAYHAGQIVLLARVQSRCWESLSIPRGESADFFRHFRDEQLGEA